MYSLLKPDGIALRSFVMYDCLFCGYSVGYFTDVCADFQSKMPVISAVAHHEGENYRLQVVVSCGESVETSQLLGVYSQLDPRVRPLVITFRYWAKVSTFIVCCAYIGRCFLQVLVSVSFALLFFRRMLLRYVCLVAWAVCLVCNIIAPYPEGWTFWQYLCTV